MRADLITESLERVAERHGDPTAAVYARLFKESPEMEPLFIYADAAVRGNMLAVVIETLLDFASRGAYAANMMRAEIVNHEGLGVPPHVFAAFFATVRDTFRDLLDTEWTADFESAWNDMLAQIDHAITSPALAPQT